MFICFKVTISCKEVHINDECEAVACQISLKHNKILIVHLFLLQATDTPGTIG